MFRRRRVLDESAPIDGRAIEEIQSIVGARFPGVRNSETEVLSDRLRDSSRRASCPMSCLADEYRGEVRGSGLVRHDPAQRFFLLDGIARGKVLTGGDHHAPIKPGERHTLVVNDELGIHHVRDRGHVDAPARIRSVVREIETTGLVRRVEPPEFLESHIKAAFDAAFFDYLRRACETVKPGKPAFRARTLVINARQYFIGLPDVAFDRHAVGRPGNRQAS